MIQREAIKISKNEIEANRFALAQMCDCKPEKLWVRFPLIFLYPRFDNDTATQHAMPPEFGGE